MVRLGGPYSPVFLCVCLPKSLSQRTNSQKLRNKSKIKQLTQKKLEWDLLRDLLEGWVEIGKSVK